MDNLWAWMHKKVVGTLNDKHWTYKIVKRILNNCTYGY